MTFHSVLNHLWQSTLVAAIAALLALALSKNQARWRYWLWRSASIKFLVPFSVLIGIGNRYGWHAPRQAAQTGMTLFMEGIGQAFAPPLAPGGFNPALAAPSMTFATLPVLLAALWLCVCAAVLRERSGGGLVELLSCADRLEPGIFGIFRQVMLWPAGISDRLADAQLEAIMTHELCHVRRRDNLAAMLRMAVEAIFWFHPLVWWLGARLVDEREDACDEEVLRLGNEPQAYSESILKTCEFCLAPPLACVAGVTGSNLKKRIKRIMARHIGCGLDGRRKLLGAAGIAAVAGPVVFGIFSAPPIRAQSQPAAKPEFDVASIKPNTSGDRRVSFQITPGGRLACTNATAKTLIMMAYDLKPHQLDGGPNWLDSDRYDVTAKGEGGRGRDDFHDNFHDDFKVMLQGLLADRFKLTFHRETKELPIYALVAAKNGPKLHATESGGDNKQQFQRMGRGQFELQGATMAVLANALSSAVGRSVMDKTGISGSYDIKLEWTPDESEGGMLKAAPDGKDGAAPAPEATGPSLFTALQEQLGLKLEAQKGPVEVVVIDHIEKASEN